MLSLYIRINRFPGFLMGQAVIAFILLNPNMSDPKITEFYKLALNNF